VRRRRVPALELLDVTLPELRHGLTEGAARSIAYELFEKLGYGAVAVTDLHQVLAFVGAGVDHHGAGDRPIRPVEQKLDVGGRKVADAQKMAVRVEWQGRSVGHLKALL